MNASIHNVVSIKLEKLTLNVPGRVNPTHVTRFTAINDEGQRFEITLFSAEFATIEEVSE